MFSSSKSSNEDIRVFLLFFLCLDQDGEESTSLSTFEHLAAHLKSFFIYRKEYFPARQQAPRSKRSGISMTDALASHIHRPIRS